MASKKSTLCELCKSSKAVKLPKAHPHHKENLPLQAWSHTQEKFIAVCAKCLEYLDPSPEGSQKED